MTREEGPLCHVCKSESLTDISVNTEVKSRPRLSCLCKASSLQPETESGHVTPIAHSASFVQHQTYEVTCSRENKQISMMTKSEISQMRKKFQRWEMRKGKE